jgi:hypothetical protein
MSILSVNFDPNQFVVAYVPPALGVKALSKFLTVNDADARPIVKIPQSRSVLNDRSVEVKSMYPAVDVVTSR